MSLYCTAALIDVFVYKRRRKKSRGIREPLSDGDEAIRPTFRGARMAIEEAERSERVLAIVAVNKKKYEKLERETELSPTSLGCQRHRRESIARHLNSFSPL